MEIELTKKEMSVLRQLLVVKMLNLEEEIRYLETLNKNGKYINEINFKQDQIDVCAICFDKLRLKTNVEN